MGEFLLSLLAFDHDGTVIFTKHLKGSHYKAGDPVPFVYPNQHRQTKRFYYRILEKFYEPETIITLLKTQDPNVIDQDGKVKYQRILQGKEMKLMAEQNQTYAQIAAKFKWNKHAVAHAIKEYQKYEAQEAEQAHTNALLDENADEHIPNPNLTAEQLAKRAELLAQWD